MKNHKYEPDICQKIASLAIDSKLAVKQIAREIKVPETTIYYWIKKERERRAKITNKSLKESRMKFAKVDADRIIQEFVKNTQEGAKTIETPEVQKQIKEAAAVVLNKFTATDVEQELIETKVLVLVKIQQLLNTTKDIEKLAKVVTALNTFKIEAPKDDEQNPGGTWFKSVNELLNNTEEAKVV